MIVCPRPEWCWVGRTHAIRRIPIMADNIPLPRELSDPQGKIAVKRRKVAINSVQ